MVARGELVPLFIILVSVIFLGTVFSAFAWWANDRGRAGSVAGWVLFEIYIVVLVSFILALITVSVWGFFFVTAEQRLQFPTGTSIFSVLYFSGAFGISFVIGLILILLHHSSRSKDIERDD